MRAFVVLGLLATLVAVSLAASVGSSSNAAADALLAVDAAAQPDDSASSVRQARQFGFGPYGGFGRYGYGGFGRYGYGGGFYRPRPYYGGFGYGGIPYGGYGFGGPFGFYG